MVFLIAGASHTGKTALAQRLLERYGYPYLSIDHLKMGLIRSGYTALTPMSSDRELTEYLWPVVREMIKTAIENRQNLTVEGCYIPFDWERDFTEEYRAQIQYRCLVMSEAYIRGHFAEIQKYANVVEQRVDDSDCHDGNAAAGQCPNAGNPAGTTASSIFSSTGRTRSIFDCMKRREAAPCPCTLYTMISP